MAGAGESGLMTIDSCRGKVCFVGAGPGDPRLITLRGVESLRQADVVLFDYLVDPQVLNYAPSSAERLCLHHHGEPGAMSIEVVNRKMVAEALQGKVVVRLKGGDPAIFGRLAEEVAAVRAAGIPLEIVPGVTAGLAAAAYTGIPLTQGQQSSAVALITGHERGDKVSPILDYAAMAEFPGTLIFYMGISTAERWSTALIREGKSPTTPAAIVRHCSWPDQEAIFCTLQTVADAITATAFAPRR